MATHAQRFGLPQGQNLDPVPGTDHWHQMRKSSGGFSIDRLKTTPPSRQQPYSLMGSRLQVKAWFLLNLFFKTDHAMLTCTCFPMLAMTGGTCRKSLRKHLGLALAQKRARKIATSRWDPATTRWDPATTRWELAWTCTSRLSRTEFILATIKPRRDDSTKLGS